MEKEIQINEKIKPTKQGNSHYFLIKPSKIEEKIIDPEEEYDVYAKKVNKGEPQ